MRTQYTTAEEARIKRERHRKLVNKKYRMDQFWLLLLTTMFCLIVYFISVYAPGLFDVVDKGNPFLVTPIICGACCIAIALLKILERKLY